MRDENMPMLRSFENDEEAMEAGLKLGDLYRCGRELRWVGSSAIFREVIFVPDSEDEKQQPSWPYPSFDARDWAEAFCKAANDLGYQDRDGAPIDEGWMISWFANALMRGYDEAKAPAKKEG